MNSEERKLVARLARSADALIDAKTRSQEHAARYMLGTCIRQLQDWAVTRSEGVTDAVATPKDSGGGR